jgi:5-methylcytosine-specific restriction protein A
MPNRPKQHKPMGAANKRTKRHKGRRPSAARRGYGRRHRRWRKMVLARDAICKRCNRAPSTDADHILPVSNGGEPYSLENGQGLCHSCHGRKTATEDGGFGHDEGGTRT